MTKEWCGASGPAPRAIGIDRLAGEDDRDPLGARVGPQDADEGARVEQRAALVEDDQVGEAEDGDLQGPRAVTGGVDLVATLAQRRGQRADRARVGIGEEDLPDGGHGVARYSGWRS